MESSAYVSVRLEQVRVRPLFDERLRQIDNGPQYTGMNFDLGKQDYLDFIDKPFPGGESFRDFARRVREFLDEKAE